MRLPAPFALPVIGALLACAALALGGCAPQQADEAPSNINGGAERSFTDEELTAGDTASVFPDTFTFDELTEDHRCQPGRAVDGAFSQGAYIVGEANAPTPGTYRLSGSLEKEGTIYVYGSTDEAGKFKVSYAISYFGFTLVSLNPGDAIFFLPAAESDLMSAASDEPLNVSAPYQSGLYRVGIDIPAGTYVVTQSEQSAEALAALALGKPAVIAYSSLDFAQDANRLWEEELPPLSDGPVAVGVTVENGQLLELFGCTANPEEA